VSPMTKRRIVLPLERAYPDCVDFSEEGSEEMISMAREAWDDMGEPKTITVTVEPGDLLND
jgi:hypothetical protein